MKKELTYQEQLKHMDEQNRIAAQKQHEEMLKKHNQHAPIHHPGSKHQYEQVDYYYILCNLLLMCGK